MTDTLKTVLVEALNDASIVKAELQARYVAQHDAIVIVKDGRIYQGYKADRLATAVTNHLFDREKVRAALIAALDQSIEHVNNGSFRESSLDTDDDGDVWVRWGDDTTGETPILTFGDGYARTDDLIDRLIAGLGGEVSQ